MPEQNLSASTDTELGYGQLFAVLLRRYLWILGALAVTIPFSAYQSLQKEPTYRSSMQLLIEPNYQERADIARARDSVFTDTASLEVDYATQIRVMQGSQLLERAVVLLEPLYPDITADEIQSYLAVFRVTETEDEVETKILQVDYTSNDPEKAQRVLEAMRTVYLDYNLEQQQLRLQNGLAFINEQLPIAREDVLAAERSLEQFRETQNLVDPEQRATDLADALNAVEEERRQIRADFEQSQAQYESLQRQLARSPQSALVSSRLSESTRYQSLLDQYQQTELTLAQQRVRFTDNAPSVRSLQQQLSNEQALLQQEVQRVLGAIAAESGLSGDRLFAEGQFGEIDLSLTADLVQVQNTLAGLMARDQGLAQAEQQLRRDLARFPELIAEYTRLQPEIEISRDTLQQLLRARQELSIEIARGGFNWQVVEEPQRGSFTGPSFTTDVLLGGIAGLFVGVVLAFAREAMDHAVRTSEQVKERSNVPILGRLPHRTQSPWWMVWAELPWNSKPTQAWMFQVLSWRPFRESLDLAYKNIQLFSSQAHLKSLAITSALAHEGKSTVALGLAITAARLHQRVLLIDADLRQPYLHHYLGIPGDRGLTTFLLGQDPDPYLYRLSLLDCTLDVLPAGTIPSDPVRLLSSDTMQKLLSDVENLYDWVILDASPVLGTVDTLQTISVCRNTLLVARLNQVSQADLTHALMLLNRFHLVGIVTNDDRHLNLKSFSYGVSHEPITLALHHIEPGVPSPLVRP